MHSNVWNLAFLVDFFLHPDRLTTLYSISTFRNATNSVQRPQCSFPYQQCVNPSFHPLSSGHWLPGVAGSDMCFIESKWSIYQIERNSLGNGLTVPSNWKGNKLPIPHSEPIQTVEGPLLGDKLWDKLIGFSVKTHRQCRTFVKLRTLSNANQVEFKFERFVFEYNWWENHSISAADCFFFLFKRVVSTHLDNLSARG